MAASKGEPAAGAAAGKHGAAGAGAGASSAAATAAAAGGNPGAFTLVHFVGGQRRALFAATRLMNPVTYIGRTADNDVVLNSENVSRRHAKLIVTDMGVTVHDLDSHNGIFLNGKKVRSTPVNVGDLLYVADVCIELRKSPDGAPGLFSGNSARVQTTEISAEEEPSARSLAALVRATDVIATADDDTCNIQTIEICRELCEATVAALVLQGPSGNLETPVVLQPESGRRGESPVHWPVVKKAIDEGLAQFSADMKRHPLQGMKEEPPKGELGAIMCVPINGDSGRAEGALYLTRPSPGHVFTERELETVAAVANLLGMRRARGARSAAASTIDIEGGSGGGDMLALQAKVEAAEERLRDAQTDIRTLTERIHGLEADALKLKQQIEVEKQGAVEAKRDAERRMSEANKLEQGLHKTDEDVKKLREQLARSEEDRSKQRERIAALDDDRKAKGGDIESLRQEKKLLDIALEENKRQLADAQEECKRAAAEIIRITDENRTARETLEKQILERTAQADALRSAVRSIIPTTAAEHVEAAAEGRPAATDLVVRPVAALTITLTGIDTWASKAPPAEVKKRLDHFCTSVALRTRANGGRVEQVLGHTHLALFAADAGSVRAAMRAGLEIQSLVPPENGQGVIVALHVGNGAAGFFGDAEHATRVEAGEASFVSRSISRLSLEPVFFATDAAQKLVAGDPAFTLALVGPTAIVGGPTLTLYRVLPDQGERGGGGGGGGGGGERDRSKMSSEGRPAS